MLKNIKNHQFSMICGRMCFWHSKENSILQINTRKTFISSPNNFLLSTRINLVIFPCGCDHLRSTQSLKSFFNLLLRCCGDANNAINFHPRQYFPFFSLVSCCHLTNKNFSLAHKSFNFDLLLFYCFSIFLVFFVLFVSLGINQNVFEVKNCSILFAQS